MEPSADDVGGGRGARARRCARRARRRRWGTPEFVAELIGDFLDALPAQLAALRNGAAETGDLELLHRVAHTLQIERRHVRRRRLSRSACRALEHAARAGRPDVHRELVERVDAEAELRDARSRGGARRAVGVTRLRGEILVVDDDPLNRVDPAARPRARGPRRGDRGERPRGARGAARRRRRRRAARHRDAADGRVPGARGDEGAIRRCVTSP